jgi:hypothetical protein
LKSLENEETHLKLQPIRRQKASNLARGAREIHGRYFKPPLCLASTLAKWVHCVMCAPDGK